MIKIANVTALILLSTALGGCLSANKLLEGNSGGGGGGGGTTVVDNGFLTIVGPASKGKVGATAMKGNYKVNGVRKLCADDPSKCDGDGDLYYGVTEVKVTRPQAVIANVNANEANTHAKLTEDGVSLFEDSRNVGSHVDNFTGLTETDYESNDEPGAATDIDHSVEIKRVPGIDAFYFFESDISAGTETETTRNAEGDFYKGVGGTLAPSSKVKTATYKGKGYGGVETGKSGVDVAEVVFVADSESTVNLDTQKLNVKLTATHIQSEGDDAGLLVGSVLSLNNIDITGSTFGGGTLTLKDKDDHSLGTFVAGDSLTVGGIYGDDAQYIAGTTLGVGATTFDDGSAGQIFVDADFWGAEAP